MPRDYPKPSRDGDRPKRDAHKPGGAFKKPWERRDRPHDDSRGYRKPFGEKREFSGAPRSSEQPRDFRPPRYDDELFAASGKVADIVGTDAQSRFDMLRKLWDFFRSEGLIVPAGHRPHPNAEDWRHEGGDRPHESRDDRPRENREDRPRESREYRPPVKKIFRKPAGEHPSARKARSLEGVPRRKYKETRER